MATSLREHGLERVAPIHPVDSESGTALPLVAEAPLAQDSTGVKQALVGHSLKKMRETNDGLRSHNQHGVFALIGFGAFFLSLFAFTQQTEGDTFLLPWRWAGVSLGTLAAWGTFFTGFAVLFIVIYGAGARTGGLVRNFMAAFEQYEIECAEGRAKPVRGFPFGGRLIPSAFYGAAYCLLGSGCAGFGLYCWGLVLMKAC